MTEVEVYVYGELKDRDSIIITNAEVRAENEKFAVSFSKADPVTVFVRYTVSYINS